jgi:hypothetical protein
LYGHVIKKDDRVKEPLTVSLLTNKFIRMIDDGEEIFLITRSWEKMEKRMG